MKKIALTGILFLFYSISYSQPNNKNNELIGYVKLKNSGNKPLPNVQVHCEGANEFITTKDGYFKLKFTRKIAGDVVRLRFTLKGHVLVGEEDVIKLAIPNDPEGLDLVIVMISEKDQQQQTSRNAEIIKAAQKAIADATKYPDSLRQLKAQLTEKNRKDTLAILISKTDLDQASTIATKAYDAFGKGEVNKAISIMDDKFLDDFSENARQLKEQLKEKDKAADRGIAQSIDNYMIKARFCLSALDIDAADLNYAKAVKADPSNFSNVSEYISFLFYQQRNIKGIEITEKALEYITYFEDRAFLLHYRGIFKQRLALIVEALNDYKEAIKLYGNYRDDEVALLHLYIGTIYHETGKIDSASKYYELGKDKYEALQKENPEEDYNTSIADARSILGSLFYERYDYPKAVANVKSALDTYETLLAETPSDNHFLYRVGYNSFLLCKIYFQWGKKDSSTIFIENAIRIYSNLIKINHQMYGDDLAALYIYQAYDFQKQFNEKQALENYHKAKSLLLKLNENPSTLRSFASLYNAIGDYYLELYNHKASEDAYNKCYEYAQKLFQLNKNLFAFDYFRSLINLATVYQKSFDNPQKAIGYLTEAGEAINHLKGQSKEVWVPTATVLYQALGEYYSYSKNYDSCRLYYQKELELEMSLPWQSNPAFKARVADCYRNLSFFYGEQLKKGNEAIEFEFKALDLYNQMSAGGENEFILAAGESYQNIAIWYKQLKKYDSAEYYYFQSLNLKKILQSKNPSVYTNSYAKTLTNLGNFYTTTENYTKADKTYLESETMLVPYLKKGNKSTSDNPYCHLKETLVVHYYDQLKSDQTKSHIDKCLANVRELEEIYKRYPDRHPIRNWEKNLEYYKVSLTRYPAVYIFAERTNKKGNELYDDHKYDEAAIYYTKAINYFNQAIQLSDSIGYKSNLYYTYYNISWAEKNMSKRIDYIEKAIEMRRYILSKSSNKSVEKKTLANAYKRKGDITGSEPGLLDTCIAAYRNAIQLYEELDSKANDDLSMLATLYFTVANKINNYAEAVQNTKKSIDIREYISSNGGYEKNSSLLADSYGNMSFYLLFVKRFSEVESFVKKGLDIDSSQIWMKTNLAHAYLFLDRYDEAIKLYQELKNQLYNNKTLGAAIIEDFEVLEKAGIYHQKIPEIKRMLN